MRATTSVARALLALLTVAATLAACTRSPAPRRWLAPAREAQRDPYGAWIVVRAEGVRAVGRPDTRADAGLVLAAGELLAIEEDSLYVLLASGRVETVARAAARRATIAWYDGQWGATAGWGLAGAVSTLSHGFALGLSAPVWIIAGSLAARADSRAPLLTVTTPAQWVDARAYARFPAGLPAGLPRVLPVKPRRQTPSPHDAGGPR
jgi:hypothetical protein